MNAYLYPFLAVVAASNVLAGESLDVADARLSLQPPPAKPTAEQTAPQTGNEPTAPDTARGQYGDAGTMWWTIGAGVASDFDTSDDYNLHVAWSWFIVDRFEWGLEAGTWYFDQEGENEFGLSAHMLFRWHFWMSEDRRWSVFADAGIGMMGTTGDVPPGGTSFDLMPRVGAGLTREIAENTRLELGVRWHHISNARINGDNSNPSRDGVLLYTGVVFPF